jgi:hypothetical protein
MKRGLAVGKRAESIRTAFTVAVLIVAAACGDAVPVPGSEPAAVADGAAEIFPPVDLVDPGVPSGVAGDSEWGWYRSAEVDLNGDGQVERVVLMARVETVGGRPAWDDGQPWRVYVEAADGTRTDVYARRLQIATLTMRVALDGLGRPGSILLLEHSADQLSVYQAEYLAPGTVQTTLRFERDLDPRGELASPQLP